MFTVCSRANAHIWNEAYSEDWISLSVLTVVTHICNNLLLAKRTEDKHQNIYQLYTQRSLGNTGSVDRRRLQFH